MLSQIHSEMNAGFVTKKREEELWETQRIITQLKVSLIMQPPLIEKFSMFSSFQRKLRMFEKRQEKSVDTEAVEETMDFTLQTTETAATNVDTKTPQEIPEAIPEVASEEAVENLDQVFVTEDGFLMLHKDHPEYMNLIRLQLENQELLNWKQQLQARINAERAECVRLKRIVGSTDVIQEVQPMLDDPEYERLVEQYTKENSLLEQKRALLAKEILDENISLIQLQVDLALKQFVH